MAQNKTVLIFGSGASIGASTAKLFPSKGYGVPQRRRHRLTAAPSLEHHHVQADLTQLRVVAEAFDTVKQKFGSAPSIVIYNAYGMHLTAEDDPLSVSLLDFKADLAVNISSAYHAAQLATEGFKSLPPDVPKTFIYTGNGLDSSPQPMLLTLGVGKSAMAHTIECAATAYAGKGWTFYYVDERLEDGNLQEALLAGKRIRHGSGNSAKTVDKTLLDTFVAGFGHKEFN
ncbi:uncharacterized protein K452DRAFT_347419 [Aplosporella prunicola CBS 121167]|uniref:NAD-dependent epimerase/dehydratase domain-containing protein n=1 Tax=Aplosporella prunicola CBS 121167 TaxID=1176127 RepID=A0A6A6BH90_9PEZI|nr:uncharacterized protein K452DRAFT_347419 [Aplosporella prunicola CBS 121167]KAF2143512.1 hypothetical protein K452DRAFT_347419 [Aplosporella prunicola CBS 121167]